MCSKCDPVVQRVRAARREIVAACGGDPHALGEWLRKIQAEYPDRVRGRAETALRKDEGRMMNDE